MISVKKTVQHPMLKFNQLNMYLEFNTDEKKLFPAHSVISH